MVNIVYPRKKRRWPWLVHRHSQQCHLQLPRTGNSSYTHQQVRAWTQHNRTPLGREDKPAVTVTQVNLKVTTLMERSQMKTAKIPSSYRHRWCPPLTRQDESLFLRIIPKLLHDKCFLLAFNSFPHSPVYAWESSVSLEEKLATRQSPKD